MTLVDRIERRMEMLYWRLGARHLSAARAFSIGLLMVAIAGMTPIYLTYIPGSEGKGLRTFVVTELIVLIAGWFGAARSWARASAPVDEWLAGARSDEQTVAAWQCIRSLPLELVRRAILWGVGGMLVPALVYGAIEFSSSAVDVVSAALAGLATGFWVSMVFVPAYELYVRPVRLELARRVGRDGRVAAEVRTRLGARLLVSVPLIALLTSFTVAIVATVSDDDWRRLAVLALIAIIATAVLSGAMVVLLTRALVSPVEDLLDVTSRVAAGDLSARAAVTTTDEIGEIGLSFNDMLEGIVQLSDHNTLLLDEVRASRSRIILASDSERVRIERNIHDGAQQRLVTLAVRIGMLLDETGVGPAARSQLESCRDELRVAIEDLRELARRLHPSILASDGLRAALDQFVAELSIPVRLEVPMTRWHPGVEATTWFVVAEALANVAKYAAATEAEVVVREEDDSVLLEVTDNGIGGADPKRGSGLRGVVDRVEAVGGSMVIDSPPGEGTVVIARVPLAIGELVGV